jgi:hypothetical protein
MKLRLKFGKFDGKDEEAVVDWVGIHVTDFPVVGSYKGNYYSYVMYMPGRGVDYDIFLAETKQTALPVDMLGCPFPVSDLEQMFGLRAEARLNECECGQKGVLHAKRRDYCPLHS